jgi:hypothetical protein
MKDQIQTKRERSLEEDNQSFFWIRERSLEEDNQSFFWIKSEGQEKLATENMVPGNQVYKEKLIIKRNKEYRLWDPFRSKLAASIMNELDYFPFENKTKVLYLGASTHLDQTSCQFYKMQENQKNIFQYLGKLMLCM